MNSSRRNFGSACLFLAPNFIGFLIFVALPVIFSLCMAFTNWDLALHNRFRTDPIQWVGLQNFRDLLSHPDFWKYFNNTLILMLGIPFGIAGSLILALLLTRPLKNNDKRIQSFIAAGGIASFILLGLWFWVCGYGFLMLIFCLVAGSILALGIFTGPTIYRTLFFLPSFTSGVAVFLLWKQMYNPLNGPLNKILQPFLDRFGTFVNETSPAFWHFFGYGCWVFAIAGTLYLAATILRSLFGKDMGFGMVLLSLTVLAAGAVCMVSLGHIFMSLPQWSKEGLQAPNWLQDVSWAKPALIIMGLWSAIGSNNMLLYIAGITNIPPELYEAADIDGASAWQRFWHVTWPQLAPTTFFIAVMSVIGGLQGGFEQARAMTAGGPFGSTTTLSYFVYSEGFETGRLGYASAVAWVIFALIFGLTLLNYFLGNRYVND
jgi:multiple sugar transport system permease protein